MGRIKNKRIFLGLWIMCLLVSLSVLPYYLSVVDLPPTISISKMVFIGVLQVGILYGLFCWIGYLTLPKTDLNPFDASHPLKRILYPGLMYGIAVGLVIFFSDRLLFETSELAQIHSPFWMGALASFYGAINEEVALRLFLFTVLYFLLKKCWEFSFAKRIYALWSVNIITALLFGLGHLPLAFKFTNPTFIDIFRILFLNGIGGLVFGWLYWSRSLWTAMVAHFVADLIIHGVLA